MNKTHQIWQRFNLLAMGIVLGQTIRLPDSLTIGTLIGLALLASIILEARFNNATLVVGEPVNYPRQIYPGSLIEKKAQAV